MAITRADLARLLLLVAGVFLAAGVLAGPASAASARQLWVDPVHGSDSRSGATRAAALRTLDAAWRRIPASSTLTRPVRINVRRGSVRASDAPNYWEHRWGTAAAPITIVSADGPGRAHLPSINMFDVRYLTLDGISIRSRFDTFHCEQCDHVTLRRSSFVGIGDPTKGQGPQETIKVNQSDDLRIEDSYIAGATDNALDMVAVDGARIMRNTIANASDWCTYAKGGSSDVWFEGNEVRDCGTGGITLGQGTGFEFMRSPWLHYEAYGSRVVNNLVHDVEGAAFGVNGGFAILVAYNTAYRVGTRDHALEVVFGERSCDGNADACAERRAAGGWGPSAPGGDPAPIGNRQVGLFHNLVYNPPGVRSQWTQFAVYGPRAAGGSGGPDPARADDQLLIRGNAIWNGPADLDLGLGGEQGCQDDNPTCTVALVRAENDINGTEPSVRIVAGVAPVPASTIAAGSAAAAAIPAFEWTGLPASPTAPFVDVPTTLAKDRGGMARAGRDWRPGAYLSSAPVTTLRISGLAGRGRITLRSGGSISGSGGSRTILRGSWVELVARPERGMRFAGWGGACAGATGTTCMVRAASARAAVTARFAVQ